jgi:hypothetical protein
MHFHWSLLAKLSSGVMRLRCPNKRSAERSVDGPIPPEFPRSAEIHVVPASAGTRTCEMNSIPPVEVAAAAANTRDLIVIDLRPGAEWRPFPGPDAAVLAHSPHDLMKALERLPSHKSLVVCVVSNQGFCLIEARSCMRVSGPNCAMEDLLTRLEVA